MESRKFKCGSSLQNSFVEKVGQEQSTEAVHFYMKHLVTNASQNNGGIFKSIHQKNGSFQNVSWASGVKNSIVMLRTQGVLVKSDSKKNRQRKTV